MITFKKQPEKFSPSNNPIVWQFESNNTVSYFDVEILTTSAALLNKFKCYITPDYPNGSYIDLHKTLTDYVDYEVKNDSLLVQDITKAVKKYRLKITEVLSNGTTGYVHDDASEEYYVWEASFDKLLFDKYAYSDYVVSPSSIGRFLTLKPNRVKVNSFSSEMLYFMQDGMADLSVKVCTYSKTGTLINTYTSAISGLSSKNLFRLQVAPKHLISNLLVDFTNVASYTVQLISGTALKSDLRTYVVKDKPCNKELVNLMWFNSLGGFDSYQFINPIQTVSTDKYSIVKTDYKLDKNGIFSNKNNNVYNPKEVIINKNLKNTMLLHTSEMSDEEARWLVELFDSRIVFIELSNGELLAASLKTSSYKVQEAKYIEGLNVSEIEIEFEGGVYPIIQSNLITIPPVAIFDTTINFSSANSTFINGVTATILSTNSTSKFEFNQIYPITGTPQSMDVNDSGTLYMVVDFVSDYVNRSCRITKANGQQIIVQFQNGTVNI